MKKDSQILIVGHNDIIEKSLYNYFKSQGYSQVFSSSAIALNTIIQNSVYHFFSQHKPEYVFLASTRSGGIGANQEFPAEFIYHNLESQNNVIHSAWKFGTRKLLFFSSSCVYPKECPQPMKEEYLLTGPLEPTSEPYAVAKIIGIKLCQSYRRQYGLNAIVMIPATIYGPGSDVDLQTAHVIGAIIGKFHEAVSSGKKEVVVWGTGKPRREFLYVDDFVEAALFLMDRYEGNEMLNVGCGYDVSIEELAQILKEVSGFSGKIIYDTSKPDGVMRKLLESSRIHKLGWRAKVDLKEGIRRTYEWYGKQWGSSIGDGESLVKEKLQNPNPEPRTTK